jgi:protease-4
MAGKRDIIIGMLIVGSIIIFGIMMLLIVIGSFTGEEIELTGLGDRIGVIEVYGELINVRDIVRQLKKYEKSGNVPAVVLHINSPGGGVVPALELYEEIHKVREKGLVVVADFGSVAASGAYLISCACDTIVSSPGTITGSIGTILSYPVAEELMDKIGLRYEVIKSGEYKDVGNFARKVNRRERQMLQRMIDDSYMHFVNIVAENRNLPVDDVLEISKGQVYSGSRALELGLVDVLGDYYDAVDTAAKMVGMEGEPKTVKEIQRRRSIWDVILGGLALVKGLSDPIETVHPQLEYILQ